MVDTPKSQGSRLILILLVVASVFVLGLYGWARYRFSQIPPLPTIGQIEGFSFTNQAGRVVASSELVGRVWVGNLIFTRCPGPCAQMTRNLAVLQQRLSPDLSVRFISLTADPDFDTLEVLDAYARQFGADPARWDFLTGDRPEINRVATEQLLLAVMEKDPGDRESENDLFLHSTKWVLVDARGRLRGVYEGTEPDSVGRVLRDIRRLLKEPVTPGEGAEGR